MDYFLELENKLIFSSKSLGKTFFKLLFKFTFLNKQKIISIWFKLISENCILKYIDIVKISFLDPLEEKCIFIHILGGFL